MSCGDSLRRLAAQGQTAIAIAELDRYLSAREAHAESPGKSLTFEEWRHRTTLQNEHDLETRKSILEAGASALKASILINGGAAAATVAFLGNVAAKGLAPSCPGVSIPGIRWALTLFVYGVLASALALGLRYLSVLSAWQLRAHQARVEASQVSQEAAGPSLKRWTWIGNGALYTAILCGLLSLAAFVWGGRTAAHSFW